jgi:hypothetical protein
MIIDFHVHPIMRRKLEETKPFFKKINAINAIEWYESLDLSVEGLIEEMNRAGVEKAVILGLNYNIDLPLIKISNDEIAALVNKNPDKFIGFASVCPTELINEESILTEASVKKAVEELRRAILELGLKGLKLLQPFQHFYPNDSLMRPLYREVEKLKIPILIHTGGEDFPGLVKYCNPIYLDDVAKEFPNIRIVAAHMGSYPFGVWFNEMMMIADENPNIYVDIAALRPRELIDLNLLEKAIKYIGSEKIIFGSDYPVVFNYTMRDEVNVIKSAKINERDRENILSLNAKRILEI